METMRKESTALDTLPEMRVRECQSLPNCVVREMRLSSNEVAFVSMFMCLAHVMRAYGSVNNKFHACLIVILDGNS
jgi:hypothetical protein